MPNYVKTIGALLYCKGYINYCVIPSPWRKYVYLYVFISQKFDSCIFLFVGSIKSFYTYILIVSIFIGHSEVPTLPKTKTLMTHGRKNASLSFVKFIEYIDKCQLIKYLKLITKKKHTITTSYTHTFIYIIEFKSTSITKPLSSNSIRQSIR